MQKPAITQTPIHAVLANRWSPRAYDASQPVTQEQLLSLLEAARWAPSCFGDQPWRFVVCDKSTDVTAWQRAYECLAPSNQSWVINAPVIVLICADSLFGHNQQANRWAQYDTGAAAENLCLQATSLGLVTHQMGGFSVDVAREKFQIPSQYSLMAMIAIGHQAAPESLPEELKERELTARKRKTLGELFFSGMWNQPVV
ncbi:MAG: nitroreductase family protein [Methylophilus sp.]|nr:nitroreductase family protein [Methylophilus sp.]